MDGGCDTRLVSKPVVAIVVAAGIGSRYGGPTPKAILKLTGRAVVGMSIEAMSAGGCTHAVVVVNPKTADRFIKHLTGSPIPVVMTTGGASRQESVHRGLQAIMADPVLREAEIVLIHDAVRPMVPAHVVKDVIAKVHEGAVAVIPAVPVTDTIRMVDEDNNTVLINRDSLRAVQTPQGFALKVIWECHEAVAGSERRFTDDASICEAMGHRAELVHGSRMGMKITEPADLTIARALWKVRETLGHHSGRRVWRHWRHNG